MHLWMIGSGLLRTHTIINVVSLQNSKIPSVMQALVSHVLWFVCGIYILFVVDCDNAFIQELYIPEIAVA